jgi:hypothetical protein
MLKGLKGLPKSKGLKGLGASNVRLPSIPLYAGPIGEKSEDPLVFEIWQVMGGKERDLKMARQCATLKRDRLPDATTPELITYVWLKERAYDFEFQVEAAGGRSSTGGSVIDFVVKSGKVWAWRIEGDFWHSRVEQVALDEIRKKNLIGAYVGSYQLDGVVDIWESSIYQDRDNVFSMALAGYQLPR